MTKAETIAAITAECRKQGLSLPEHIAYVLATAEWETAGTLQPVREAYWKDETWRRQNLRYYPYYGRGFVQLTWEDNYRKYAGIMGIDLVGNPDLALEPQTALFILVHGFRTGAFTGKKLTDYINAAGCDFIQARRCINGLDKAREIAALAEKYLAGQSAIQEDVIMNQARVTASALNLRQPFPKGQILTTLPQGEVVEVAKYGWFEVKTRSGRVGWVWSEYLEPVSGTGISESPVIEPPASDISEWPWLKIARQELGVKEVAGTCNNPRVVEYLKSTTLGSPDNQRDETPWCSAFVNWVLKQAGVDPRTNSAWARSWLNWGVSTEEPIPGTIVIFSRGTNAGHVAFYLDEDADRIQVLGGNQGNAVTIAWFPKANFLGYREPKGWEAV